MKRFTNSLPALALLLPLSLGLAFGQAETPGQEQPSPQAQPEAAQAVSGLELEGELRAIDPEQMIFLIVDADGNELLFRYDSETEVGGETDGVQGLTGQSGTWLLVQYRAEGTTAIAERIELVDRAPAGDPAPDSEEPGAGPGR